MQDVAGHKKSGSKPVFNWEDPLHLDAQLTEEGRANAVKLADFLRRAPPRRLLVSDPDRARALTGAAA